MLRRNAFTLVELMVTMAIIALLASFLIGSLYMAQQAANRDRTKAIIARLDAAMKQRWEAYQWRPIPLSMDQAVTNWNARRGSSGSALSTTAISDLHVAKLGTQREILRIEMPSRWSDLDQPLLFLPQWKNSSGSDITPSASAVPFSGGTSIGFRLCTMHNLLKSSSTNPGGATAATNYNNKTNVSAEFLYMILTNEMPGAPSIRSQLAEHEIGDTDQDGALEIIDGWGNPIYFQRWVPGFTPLSDVQRNDAQNSHDALDIRRVDPTAYQLYPLIYSVGPDGMSGLGMALDSPEHAYGTAANMNNPFSNPNIGAPVTSGNELGRHYDNVHNHTLNAK